MKKELSTDLRTRLIRRVPEERRTDVVLSERLAIKVAEDTPPPSSDEELLILKKMMAQFFVKLGIGTITDPLADPLIREVVEYLLSD